jgi:hypothetical protein
MTTLGTIRGLLKDVDYAVTVKERQAGTDLGAVVRAKGRERVLLIDPAVDQDGEPTSAYWFASCPSDELLGADPLARSRYRRVPRRARTFAYVIAPSMTFLGTFGLIFLTAGAPRLVWLPALLIAVVIGWAPGLLGAWLWVKLMLRTEVLWVFMRIANGADYSLKPVVPPPVQQSDQNAGMRPFIIRAGWMKKVAAQDAARTLYSVKGRSFEKLEFAALVTIAIGLFALIFLVQALTEGA